jgi:hypothetical protein
VHIDGLKRLGRFAVIGAVALGLMIAAVVWYRRRRRSQGAARALRPEAAEAVRLYLELERTLQNAGQGRAAAVTPVEHAANLAASGLSYAADVRAVTDSYMRVRFGEGSLDETEREQLRAAIARVKRAAKLEPVPTQRAS